MSDEKIPVIIMIVGPPNSGKTAFAMLIEEALKKENIKVVEVSDEKLLVTEPDRESFHKHRMDWLKRLASRVEVRINQTQTRRTPLADPPAGVCKTCLRPTLGRYCKDHVPPSRF